MDRKSENPSLWVNTWNLVFSVDKNSKKKKMQHVGTYLDNQHDIIRNLALKNI